MKCPHTQAQGQSPGVSKSQCCYFILVETMAEGRGDFREEVGLKLGSPWNSFLLSRGEERKPLWSKVC